MVWPARPSTSPVCAKRSIVRELPAGGAARKRLPLHDRRRWRDRASACRACAAGRRHPASIVKTSGAVSGRHAQGDCAPAGHLPLGARQLPLRARRGGPAAFAAVGGRPAASRRSGSRPARLGARAPRGAGGGFSPTTRYTRLLAQGYEMTVAESTTRTAARTTRTPIVLCQLKSRALPGSPRGTR